MKPTTVALLSVAGMLLAGASVYTVTPAEADIRREPEERSIGGAFVRDSALHDVKGQGGPAELARFSAGSNLMVEGRVGHTRLVRSGSGKTFVLLEAKASSATNAAPAPVDLSIVIDRSGSMRGTRLRNAVAAATTAIDRLQDGDIVSVVAFDTRPVVIVPPTPVDPSSRGRIADDVRRIALGGDTCISCGVEEALALLERSTGRVDRMIVLSDGAANHGVRDVTGFRAIAQRAQARGVSVTTIGVDVDYDEKLLAALALESNGRHYFVENDAALARVFDDEAARLKRTVFADVEATIDLAPGVELERVYDRTFRRNGGRVTVPLGTFSEGETKTVLLEVRVPTRTDGPVAVADVELAYRDLALGSDARCSGKLAVEVTSDRAKDVDLDPVVAARVERAETAAALKTANELFAQGKADEARRRLESRVSSLSSAAAKAKPSAPPARKADVDRDFAAQRAALAEAQSGFATPPAPTAGAPAAAPQQTREGRSAVKRNQQIATDFSF